MAGRIREWLRARGQRTSDVRRLLDPLRQIEGDVSFWKWPGEGLAFFGSAESFRFYRLAFGLPQRLSIGGHFDASPLILNSGLSGRYFVLALSCNGARLLECSPWGHRRIQPGPKRQVESAAGRRFGKDDIDGLVGHFQEVDARLDELFGDNPVPLVLAAQADLASACRLISNYPGLMEQVVEEAPEQLSDLDLQQRACLAAQPVLAQGFQDAYELFERMSGAQATSARWEEIQSAALDGRVQCLFVATEPELQGRLSRMPAQADWRRQILQKDRCSTDWCALKVLSMGGKVFAVDSRSVPGGGSVAAIFHAEGFSRP